MKTAWVWVPVLMSVMLATSRPVIAADQTTDSSVHFLRASLESGDVAAVPESQPPMEPEPPVRFRERDLSGPRFGITIAGGDGSVYRDLKDHGMGPVISQFGWQFEHQVAPLGGGPQLVTEIIPFFGGVEYGKFIPSLTMVLGVRLPSGAEFGVGPSFTVVSSRGKMSAGLVLAGGKTIDYGGVCIPMNLAVSLNQKGTRFTLTAGYAIRRASR